MNGRALDLIRVYHLKYHPDQQDATPTTVGPDLLESRRRLYVEEAKEAADAFAEAEEALRDPSGALALAEVAHLLHELADVVIVAYGTAMRLGVDLDAVAEIVLDHAMHKIPNPDPAGKAIKPPGYVPADTAVLAYARWSSTTASKGARA